MADLTLTSLTGLDLQPETINGKIPPSKLHGFYVPELTTVEINSLLNKPEMRNGFIAYDSTTNVYQGLTNDQLTPLSGLTSAPYLSVYGGDDDVYQVPLLPNYAILGHDTADEQWSVSASKGFNVIEAGVNWGSFQYVGTTFPRIRVLINYSFSIACTNLGGGIDFIAQIHKNNVPQFQPAFLNFPNTGIQINLSNNIIMDIATNDIIAIKMYINDAPSQPMNAAGATVTITTIDILP